MRTTFDKMMYIFIAIYLSVWIVNGCRVGFYGDHCNILCPSHCAGNVCDNVTGTCFNCTDGWTGSVCISPCPINTYGRDCRMVCRGHCKHGCNHVTGTCDNGCDDGWQGKDCTKECAPGTYGGECNTTCGHCRAGGRCFHIDGRCPNGCDPGFEGKRCDDVCAVGHYGDGCSRQCNATTSCDHVTGICCGIPNTCSTQHCKFGGGLVAGLSVSFVVSVIVNAALSYKIFMVYCRE
ncbi:multiple epidermal growth factor-like domains protein 11 [Ostrea edulis]|uniref:multiple epidermal growth factor-like domains protein 11 n=1 Tax=Ostrea edulis TaxID=37623 RepID=UPI0024AFFBBE|nr:multiple epidermal growth factor-like domains protein 11 [Ostrea edulis]